MKNESDSSKQENKLIETEYKKFIGKYDETDLVTPFLITQPVENRSSLSYLKIKMSMKTLEDHEKVDEKFVHSKIDKICG